eukprot:m.364953 g.364953  ORF g.364953 m.364953 type:complete len:837 (-) comp29190_c0_seq1:263-2773(-)
MAEVGNTTTTLLPTHMSWLSNEQLKQLNLVALCTAGAACLVNAFALVGLLFFSVSQCRRPPKPPTPLKWKVICDVVTSLNVLWFTLYVVEQDDVSHIQHDTALCHAYSGVSEGFTHAGFLWLFFLSVEVLLAARNPFRKLGQHHVLFHAVSWLSAALLSIFLVRFAVHEEDAFTACWNSSLKQDTISRVLLLFKQLPITYLFVICWATAVVLKVWWGLKAAQSGVGHGLLLRKLMLKRALIFLIVYGLMAIFQFATSLLLVTVGMPKPVDAKTLMNVGYADAAFLLLNACANMIVSVTMNRSSLQVQRKFMHISAAHPLWRKPSADLQASRRVRAAEPSAGSPRELSVQAEDVAGTGRVHAFHHSDSDDSDGDTDTVYALHSTPIKGGATTQLSQTLPSPLGSTSTYGSSPTCQRQELLRVVGDEYEQLQLVMDKALRYDTIMCTLFAIMSTLNRSHYSSAIQHQTVVLPPTWNRKVDFIDYHPQQFAALRSMFGISPELYATSLWGNDEYRVQDAIPTMTEQFGTGKSGAFFYTTYDKRFLVKTVTRAARDALMEMLPNYKNHLQHNPASLLTRYCGLHSVRLSSEQQYIHIVVLVNVLSNTRAEPTSRLTHVYDLKGSWVNRSGSHTDGDVLVDLSNADAPVSSLMDDFMEVHPLLQPLDDALETISNEVPSGNSTRQRTLHLKDNDLVSTVEIGGEAKDALAAQLHADVAFLHQHQLTDYSLLVGLRRVEDDDTMLATTADNSDLHTLSALSLAEDEDEPVYYEHPVLYCCMDGDMYLCHVGVIDTLQEFTLRKRAEVTIKRWILCQDKHGISAQQPSFYAIRFLDNVIAHFS